MGKTIPYNAAKEPTMLEKSSAILITGAGGFVGKNLVYTLENLGYTNLFCFEIDDTADTLQAYCEKAAFVVHLAGINRPKDPSEFYTGNTDLTVNLLAALKAANNKAPVLVTSSIQAELDNDYGKSKRAAEDAIFDYGEATGAPVYVVRMEGVFGKWCRPNYNSVVATFCHNAANGIPLEVRDRDYTFPLVYIDDVIRCIVEAFNGNVTADKSMRPFCHVTPVHTVTLGFLADTITGFVESRKTLATPYLLEGSIEKKLYSTYLSYLPVDKFSYPLTMHCDARGSFTEILRTPERGQCSVNLIRPGITKGNHWHNSKNEKYLVVSGECTTRLRKVGTDDIIEYVTTGDALEVIDIPTGYTHSIQNTGAVDAAVFMWVNESFDAEHPDTIFLEV